MDVQVVPFDLQRMFLGDQSLLFGLEIIVRTLVVYAYALVLLRWLGSRTIGQLSTVEFLLVIALGSAVGDPMFYPDVPLLHALVVVTVVVLANKGLDLLVATSRRAERAIDGTARMLIADGVLTRDFLDGRLMGRGEIFQLLRRHGVEQLGEVREAYIEPDGEITIFRHPRAEKQPGLPIVPPWEIREPPRIAAATKLDEGGVLACRTCGKRREVPRGSQAGICGHCAGDTWTHALRSGVRPSPPEVSPRSWAGSGRRG